MHEPEIEIGEVDTTTGFIEPTSFTDPLADDSACARDLPYLKDLGVNVVHVYSVNSSLSHDSCMSALSGAGIYTMYVNQWFRRLLELGAYRSTSLASTLRSL